MPPLSEVVGVKQNNDLRRIMAGVIFRHRIKTPANQICTLYVFLLYLSRLVVSDHKVVFLFKLCNQLHVILCLFNYHYFGC